MIDRPELHALPASGIEQPIGELALRTREVQALFGVTSEEVITLTPSVVEGGQAFLGVVRAMNPQDKRLHEGQEPEPDEHSGSDDPAVAALAEAPNELGLGRDLVRKNRSQYGNYLVRLIQTGAQYLATFDDPEEGIRAGREILPEDFDEATGGLYIKRIVPGAEPIRHLHRTSRATTEEVKAIISAEG